MPNDIASFLLMWCCRPVQVGIKYGGKGEVDVAGLEMELREPYKVRKTATKQRHGSAVAAVAWGEWQARGRRRKTEEV